MAETTSSRHAISGECHHPLTRHQTEDVTEIPDVLFPAKQQPIHYKWFFSTDLQGQQGGCGTHCRSCKASLAKGFHWLALLKSSTPMLTARPLHRENAAGYTTLDHVMLHYVMLHSITSNTTRLHVTLHTIHYVTLCYIEFRYITLYFTTLHYIPLRHITLHFVELHYVTLHYVTLQYIALHCTTYIAKHQIRLHYHCHQSWSLTSCWGTF